MNDNTDERFFSQWTHRQLREECARLNQVLKDCLEIARKATESEK